LILLGVVLLTLAFAPVNQFYLAWIGLVPWLIVLAGTRAQWSAFLWSWLAGTLFFIANMWWISYVTGPGMVGLMVILGLYWGYAGIIIRGAGLLERIEDRRWRMEDSGAPTDASLHPPSSILNLPLLRIALLAAIWVAAGEWFRGTWPWNGLPWLHLGHTQTPALWICQIADVVGVAGISFVIAMANAWVAMWILNRLKLRGLVTAGVAIIAIILAVIGYGIYRFHTEQLTPGAKVVVVQANYPQSNTGEKGAELSERVAFHVDQTRAALETNKDVDLVAWSETMMPMLNDEARLFFNPYTFGREIEQTFQAITRLTQDFHISLLTGGQYWTGIKVDARGMPMPSDSRNSAYYFDRDGLKTVLRYDKIHLVPFGEFVPFKYSIPPLYRLMISFGPPDMEYYFLTPGDEQHLTVFPLTTSDGRQLRFVTPICFEDIDPGICARMFRPEPSDPDRKRADFMVNLTNDGWFKANENSQHVQAAIFRSIENRVPTARSVNTGVSGFIDPLGRTHGLVPVRTAGASVETLMLDARVTLFTRWGQWFGIACAAVTVIVAATSFVQWITRRRARAHRDTP
jgi:apolipoprotein N-acyltransferase